MSQDKVQVVFCKWGNEKEVAQELGDCYILTPDNWDDYGYKTAFNVQIFKDSDSYKSSRKFLLENQNGFSSGNHFEELLNGRSYIKVQEIALKIKFISLGNDYEELKKIFPDDYIDILKVLNDVIYLESKEPESELLKLKEHEAFEKSLCRDQSSKKVLEEGKLLLFGEVLDSNRFDFDFTFNLNEKKYLYSFNFNQNELPNRISVLIGKNGSGKSQTLLALSEYLLDNRKYRDRVVREKHPNFLSHMLVFAYNPHDNFVVPKKDEKFDIEYKYIGYRKQKEDVDTASLNEEALRNMVEELKNFDISEVPRKRLFQSFWDIYKKDRNNLAHEIQIDDVVYLDKVFEHLQKAFECDAIGLKLKNMSHIQKYTENGFTVVDNCLLVQKEEEKELYVREIQFDDFETELYYFNNNNQIFLSSGQQTFADFIINLLSLIKANSLVLIDEPENTLHPNLEVDFIRISQEILEDFESFAIIATHSAIITREVPENSVHVIKFDESAQPFITHPSIKTFGADIGTITNYVFDDIFKEEKPYENWFLEEKVNYETFEQFEEKYRSFLNYDFLLYCKNSWDIKQ
jgi:predicted ATPase